MYAWLNIRTYIPASLKKKLKFIHKYNHPNSANCPPPPPSITWCWYFFFSAKSVTENHGDLGGALDCNPQGEEGSVVAGPHISEPESESTENLNGQNMKVQLCYNTIEAAKASSFCSDESTKVFFFSF